MAKEIKQSVLSFPVEFETINDYAIDDDRFTKVRIFLMHTGLNENNGFFEKKVVEEAVPTIEYCPIVGFIKNNILDGKDFSDHHYIITKDENGVRRKYTGHSYGVVLSNIDNNAHFEMRLCDDGVEREFLVVEGVIWNMFEDAADILNRDCIKKHSMELFPPSVEGYEDENEIFHYTKFSFRAACILGNDEKYNPAMKNSTVEVETIAITDFIKQVQDEISEKYVTFTKMVSEDIQNDKGGTMTMAKNTDFQTVMQQVDDISTMVSQFEVFEDRWGDAVPRYYFVDIQDNEVIVVDRKTNYQYVGLPFTVDGDKVNIDFSSGNRKKICYENYEEGTTAPQGSFDFGEHIAEIEKTAFEKVQNAESKVTEANEAKETIETDFTNMKKEYDEIKPKYDEFCKAKEEQEAKELANAKNDMFAKFEDVLADNADFTAIKENADELSLDDIEQKCSVLFTRVSMSKKSEKNDDSKTNFTKKEDVTVGLMDDESGTDDGMTYVPTKYGNIPTRR